MMDGEADGNPINFFSTPEKAWKEVEDMIQYNNQENSLRDTLEMQLPQFLMQMEQGGLVTIPTSDPTIQYEVEAVTLDVGFLEQMGP